eukprot:scaffold115_cov304-Prasinococcus_capsulatus_cf.AAC.43
MRLTSCDGCASARRNRLVSWAGNAAREEAYRCPYMGVPGLPLPTTCIVDARRRRSERLEAASTPVQLPAWALANVQ